MQLFYLFRNFIGSVNYKTFDNKLNFTGTDWKIQPIFIIFENYYIYIKECSNQNI